MTRTVEDLAFERRQYKDALREALTKMEGLYRIIYGYNKLGEKPSDNQEYIASEYCVQTRRALADENGWTGRKCPVCAGTGDDDNKNLGSLIDHDCPACRGTGEENIGAVRPPIITEDAPEATPEPANEDRRIVSAHVVLHPHEKRGVVKTVMRNGKVSDIYPISEIFGNTDKWKS